jgi:hypothetical protein
VAAILGEYVIEFRRFQERFLAMEREQGCALATIRNAALIDHINRVGVVLYENDKE